MVNEELEKKFEKPEFKQLLKDHRNSTIWDLVLFAISLLCLIIISFTPCIEISGEKFYTEYMLSLRDEYIRTDGKMFGDNESKNLVEGRTEAIQLVLEHICERDDEEAVKSAEKFGTNLMLATGAFILQNPDDIKNLAEYQSKVEEAAKAYSELKLSYSIVDFVKIVLGETKLKPEDEGVGVFTVAGFGNFFAIIVPTSYFAVCLIEIVSFIISIVKLCANKKYTQFMYNKRYTEYGQKHAKIRGGIQSLGIVFYAMFSIFYFCSSSKSKFFKDPARMFFGAVKITPLFYVMLGISLIVFIMSAVNIFRKKNIHYWMCTHA